MPPHPSPTTPLPVQAVAAARRAARRLPRIGGAHDLDHGGPLWSRPTPPSYLFVIGCERSGTTVLTRLLQAHPQVALGMERYKYLLHRVREWPVSRRLNPSHFEPGRFFDFRRRDSNIIPPNFAEYYEQTAERYRNPDLRYVGDKVLPASKKLFGLLADRFPDARYVFIYRDVEPVASSFEVRARDADDSWPSDRGFAFGVAQWTRAFAATELLMARAGAEQVCVVRYDDLFGGGTRALDAMFAFLGLDPGPVHPVLAARTEGWRPRPVVLDERQRRQIRDQVDHDLVARFDARADRALARVDG